MVPFLRGAIVNGIHAPDFLQWLRSIYARWLKIYVVLVELVTMHLLRGTGPRRIRSISSGHFFSQSETINPVAALEMFFTFRGDDKDTPPIRERQDKFLRELIERRHDDANFMQFVFDVIAQFPNERRRSFVVRFLEHNKNFEDFERLPLERLGVGRGVLCPSFKDGSSTWSRSFRSSTPWTFYSTNSTWNGISKGSVMRSSEKKVDFMED